MHSDRLRLCEAADGTVGVAGIPVVLPTATGPVLEEATGAYVIALSEHEHLMSSIIIS